MAKPLLKRLTGEFNPDGTIKSDPELSALSERPTQAGDMLVTIPGTPYFYRLLATENRLLTEEVRAELEAEYRTTATAQAADAKLASPKEAEGKPAPVKKD